ACQVVSIRVSFSWSACQVLGGDVLLLVDGSAPCGAEHRIAPLVRPSGLPSRASRSSPKVAATSPPRTCPAASWKFDTLLGRPAYLAFLSKTATSDRANEQAADGGHAAIATSTIAIAIATITTTVTYTCLDVRVPRLAGRGGRAHEFF
ncbi:hypothetical protein, partial [Pollutimonas bauzanensis]|uniref:hypothetical protein n=1 Tax=Pollutimonas bauzanensis TaxID=658167 RepID=UPI00333EB58E